MKVGNLRVLVKPQIQPQQERKIGSIIVPSTLRHKKILTEGVVMQAGAGTPEIPMEVKEGDTVLFLNDDSRLQVGGGVLIKMEDILFVAR
jgi:co-chaperonin GroES (HSP10)